MGANQSSQEPVPAPVPLGGANPSTVAVTATKGNQNTVTEKASVTGSNAVSATNAAPASSSSSTQSPYPSQQFQPSILGAQQYMSVKVPAATALGGLTGLTTAYYMGDAIVLTTGIFGVATGMTATAFLIGTYSLQSYRQKNDVLNFAISGFFNGGLIITALRGKKMGAVGAVVGGALGALVKAGGDELYSMSRDAWVASRKFTIGEYCSAV
jgi:hypothetical protein